ncbi:MAG: hypothetical protein HND53_06615 [Proteobacteria bacterium]|nr:hypothetical protein [Pseudomonadota bacterium]NOG60156.1 hypothetical protein [Pseudomonadota bacterium]
MEVLSDFKERLELFNSHKINYLVAGGYALAYHGAPRFTGDIDLYVKPDSENAEHILNALQEFGFGSLKLTKEDFMEPGQIIQLGMPPGRIDIITSISGVDWEEAFTGKVEGTCGGVPVNFLGREQFIKNKKATGRAKDLADLEALGEKPEKF